MCDLSSLVVCLRRKATHALIWPSPVLFPPDHFPRSSPSPDCINPRLFPFQAVREIMIPRSLCSGAEAAVVRQQKDRRHWGLTGDPRKKKSVGKSSSKVQPLLFASFFCAPRQRPFLSLSGEWRESTTRRCHQTDGYRLRVWGWPVIERRCFHQMQNRLQSLPYSPFPLLQQFISGSCLCPLLAPE